MTVVSSLLPSNGILSLAAIVFAGYYLVSAIYNIFFHPLANVPGPFLAKISSLPSFYHAYKGDRHIWLWQNFQLYGSKLRATPNSVIYNDGKSYNQIYGHKANVRRSDFYQAFQRNKDDVNTLNTTDLAVHSRKRSLLLTVFTEKAVRAACGFVNKHVDRWHELMTPTDTKEWSDPIDFSYWTQSLILDLFSDLCFGRSFEIKEPGDNELKVVPSMIFDYMRFYYPIVRSPFTSFLIWVKPRGLDILFEAISPKPVKQYFKFIAQSVTDRMALEQELESRRDDGESVREDMFHFLAQAKDPETGKPAYSEQELRCEANLLIIAGSDTTTTTLCSFFFYITQDSRVYAKLLKEIMATFASPEEITGSPKLLNCEYLRACLRESMRMTPAGPSELPRTVLKGGTEILGEFLPEGIEVGHSGWCTGRNEEIYGDCNMFRPERWIVDEQAGNTADMVAALRSCSSPFNAGSTRCVGESLALMEICTIIGRTLYRFDVRRAPGLHKGEGRSDLGWGQRDKRQYQVIDGYISLRQGPMLQFKKRVL